MAGDRDAIEKRVRELLAQVLGISAEKIGPGLSQETEPYWTSLNHLMLISQIENEFGTTLSNTEIRELTSYDRIVHKLAGR